MNYKNLEKILSVRIPSKDTVAAIFGNRVPASLRSLSRLSTRGLAILEESADDLVSNCLPMAERGQIVATLDHVVSDEILARIAREFHLDKLVHKEIARAFSVSDDYLSDIVIALVGYVESVAGTEKSREFIARILHGELADVVRDSGFTRPLREVDSLNRLYGMMRNLGRRPPRYVEQSIPPGLFRSHVIDSGTGFVLAHSSANSPKRARVRAAVLAMRRLREVPDIVKVMMLLENKDSTAA